MEGDKALFANLSWSESAGNLKMRGGLVEQGLDDDSGLID